jgi:hypothetical protein
LKNPFHVQPHQMRHYDHIPESLTVKERYWNGILPVLD